jgi:hypothetical protein
MGCRFNRGEELAGLAKEVISRPPEVIERMDEEITGNYRASFM